ncbi:MAG TPA: hypothetical protein PLN21_04845 [Gemmatales bacterium]|nr:hypothetical protein [Gemmatales bacterium]
MLPESNDDLSQTLKQLKVATSALDKDRLLFEAGRRSVQHSLAWPMATAASLLLAGVISLSPLLARSETERIVYLPVPEAAPSTLVQQEGPTEDSSSYVMLLKEMTSINPSHRLPDISPGKSLPMLTAGSIAPLTP